MLQLKHNESSKAVENEPDAPARPLVGSVQVFLSQLICCKMNLYFVIFTSVKELNRHFHFFFTHVFILSLKKTKILLPPLVVILHKVFATEADSSMQSFAAE